MDGEDALPRQGGTAAQGGRSELSNLERGLLALPALGGLFFGLMPLIAPGTLAQWGGYTGADRYIYRLAGAATLGYAVALALAIREGKWSPVRIVVIATLAFNLASLFACGVEIIQNRAPGSLYIVLIASLLFVVITGWMLYAHSGAALSMSAMNWLRSLRRQEGADIAGWVVWLVVVATLSAAIFGLLPLFFPRHFAEFFGYNGYDVIIYRIAGAATLGYAVMGVFELWSRKWNEMRLPAVMALVFNGVGFLASVWSFTRQEDPKLLPIIVAVASLGVTIGTALTLQRNGK